MDNDLCLDTALELRTDDRRLGYIIQTVWIWWIPPCKQQKLCPYLLGRAWQVVCSVVKRREVVETADIFVTHCFVFIRVFCCTRTYKGFKLKILKLFNEMNENTYHLSKNTIAQINIINDNRLRKIFLHEWIILLLISRGYSLNFWLSLPTKVNRIAICAVIMCTICVIRRRHTPLIFYFLLNVNPFEIHVPYIYICYLHNMTVKSKKKTIKKPICFSL